MAAKSGTGLRQIDVKALQQQLVEKGIRAIFVKSGIDTADGDRWRTTFQLFAAFASRVFLVGVEFLKSSLASDVRDSLEELAELAVTVGAKVEGQGH